MDDKQTQWRARLAAACLMTLIGVCHAGASERPQPARSTVEALETKEAGSIPMLSGNFFHAGSGDTAALMHSTRSDMTELYALVVIPNANTGQMPQVVKSFTTKDPDPPHLSVVKPGDYKPVCHSGGPCAPVKIATEAISICFGEASCRIVYYNGSAFRELVVTD